MARPTGALVDLAALRHNCQVARSLSGAGKLMAVVKANAYGHGAMQVASALEPLVDAFAVACIEEAQELRESGIELPLILMEGIFSPDELVLAARHNFWVMVQNEEQLAGLEHASLPGQVTCWLKLDSGMHRLGFPLRQAAELVNRLRNCPSVAPNIVLATHLACADDLDNDFTREQIRRVREYTAALDLPASLANSPGLLGWPESRAEWNRAGVMLYGQSPFPGNHPEGDKLKPVMTLSSRIIALRDVSPGESVGYGGAWTADKPSRDYERDTSHWLRRRLPAPRRQRHAGDGGRSARATGGSCVHGHGHRGRYRDP